jgi:DNA polymerase-3 subunit epsilon
MKLLVLLALLIKFIIDYWHFIAIAAVSLATLVLLILWRIDNPTKNTATNAIRNVKNLQIPHEGLEQVSQMQRGIENTSDEDVALGPVNWDVINNRARPYRDVSYVPERFIVFDLETTGLDPTKHEIIEIGAILVNRDEFEHETFQRIVLTKKKLPGRIIELTGITDEKIRKEGVPLKDALSEFYQFVGNLRMVSFNIEFDLAFLNNAASRHGLYFNNETSCALKMARLAWPGRKRYGLMDIAISWGLPLSDAHRALGDCERALYVYVAATGVLKTA